jgi:hypothetical protein
MENTTNFVVMDKNDTHKRSAAEQPKKSGREDLQEKGPAGSQALSLVKSGWQMARIVFLLFLLTSCSYNLSPTTAQKEQKKFSRFKVAPKDALILTGSAFVGYGIGKELSNGSR